MKHGYWHGLIEFAAVLGGLCILGVAALSAVAPLVQARYLEAQAAADIAAANRVMAQGLADVATAGAVTPLAFALLAGVIALGCAAIGVAWAVVARDYLRLRAQAHRLAPPDARPRVSLARDAQPAAQLRATWQPAVLTLREWRERALVDAQAGAEERER